MCECVYQEMTENIKKNTMSSKTIIYMKNVIYQDFVSLNNKIKDCKNFVAYLDKNHFNERHQILKYINEIYISNYQNTGFLGLAN